MTITKKAFTLTELVITIAIIIVLATISTPIYKKYVLESRRSEGYILLGTIRDAQMRYYSEFRRFLSGNNSSIKSYAVFSCNENVLGVDARTNKYFTSFRLDGGAYDFIVYAQSRDAGIITLYFNKTSGVTFY